MSKIGFVYRIIDNTNGNQYYGSTTQTVSSRMTGHRSKFKNGKLGCTSIGILKNGNFRYETLEKVLFEDKFELQNVERKYIENNECVNKNTPNRTDEEAKEYYQQYSKQYQIDNADHIKQYCIDNDIELHYHKRQHNYSSSELRARVAKLENMKDDTVSIPQHSPELIK